MYISGYNHKNYQVEEPEKLTIMMQMDWARGYHSSHHVSQQMVGLLSERVKLNYIHCYNFHTILRNTLCNSGYRTLIEIFGRIPTM